VRALVCVEKCVNNYFKEKSRRGKYSSQLLPIATCVCCFKDPTVKPCLIDLQFLLNIPHSYFSNLDGGIIYLRYVEPLVILWRAAVRRKFLLPSVLIVSEIQQLNLLQLLWNFYWSCITHITFFWTVGFEIRAVVCF